MRRSMVFLAMLVCVHNATAQDAIQWPEHLGGNGHWYVAILAEPGVSWDEAQLRAVSVGGYLATTVSGPENQWVFENIAADPVFWIPNSHYGIGGPWLGARQAEDSCEPGCGWEWVTGESWDFQKWHPAQPDDGCSTNENALQYWFDPTDPTAPGEVWNDLSDTGFCSGDPRVTAYVIEWSADCNGDGIVDYGQILDGTFDDLDGNGVPDCCDQGTACGCRVDLNGDDLVDTQDFLVYLNLWVQRDPIADWDRDGQINSHDVMVFLNDWVAGC